MKRVALSILVAGMAASSAMAADMATKAPPAAAPPPSPWDVAITAALMTDYNFRGITQSAHNPSTQATFEPRYNFNSTWQGYVGLSGESIDFPNQAAAEIDFYGGIRPTFDKLALDFGFWYYWYPGGNCYGNAPGSVPGTGICPNAEYGPPSVVPLRGAVPATGGNVVKSNESFYEWYAKATYTINDQWSVEGQYYYSPSVSNTGATGNYITGNLTYTAPASWFPANSGLGGYISGDIGYWDLGHSDVFYGTGIIAPGAIGHVNEFSVPYTSYWNWDAGFGWTYKAFTLDLRYYDSNLSKSECNAFTSASNSSFSTGNITNQNPTGLGSNWCSAAYIAKLSFQVNLSGLK